MRRVSLALFALLVAVTGLARAATAHEYVVGDLFIYHPHSHPTPPGSSTTEGYMALTNLGSEPERLLAIIKDGVAAELRDVPTAGGVAGMTVVEGIDIPPGETVALVPGGTHVLFIGQADQPLRIGDRFAATLVFERLGDVAVEVWVEGRAAGPLTEALIDPMADALTGDAGRDNEPEPAKPSLASKADHKAITDLMTRRLDTDVVVAPITVVDRWAVAGWRTGQEAGRAFLRKTGDDWALTLLSGESLMTPAGLQAQGLPPRLARRLHSAIQANEAELPAASRARFDGFVGTLVVDTPSSN